VIALVALLGAGFGLGLTAVVAGTVRAAPAAGGRPKWATGVWWQRVWRQVATRAGIAVAVAAMVAAVTRWPVGALLAGIASYVLPVVLGADRQAREVLARTEAVAVWAEMLRDSLSAAAGLEQTILLTAPFTPAAIADEVTDLTASLRAGRRLSVALEEFTARIDDPTGRLVARALAQASRRQSRQLPELLSELARRARERANLQLRIAPGHAKIRTNARIIVAFTLAMAAGMVVFNREFLRPYDSPLGQLVLLAVGIIFAAGFVALTGLARTGAVSRGFLASQLETGPGTSVPERSVQAQASPRSPAATALNSRGRRA
jgi:tight adherence protein B